MLAALGLGLLSSAPGPGPAKAARVVARRDPAFVVADSVGALLSFVTCLAVDDDSILYLADYRLSAVLKFDARGGFLGPIGRRGSGPGEFYSVFSVGLHRDSLWAMDPGLVRLTFFPRRGRGATTFSVGNNAPLSASPAGPRVRSGLPIGVFPDGMLLFQESLRDSASPTGEKVEGLLLRTTRSLDVIDTVARYPMTHSGMGFVYRDGETHMVQPFGDDPLFAVSRDGSVLVVVSRPAQRRGAPGRFTVTAWQDGKAKVFSREIGYTPRRLARAVVDSVVGLLAQPGGRDAPRTPVTADSVRRRLYRPGYYPPVKDVKVARDGTIWLQVNFGDGPADGAEWLQLSSHGFELGRVVLPVNFKLLEAERRALWGVEGDRDDIPVLSRYVVPDTASAL
jgi:hypothetical protein